MEEGSESFAAFARLCARLGAGEAPPRAEVERVVGGGGRAAAARALLTCLAAATDATRAAVADVFKRCRTERGAGGSVVTVIDQQDGAAAEPLSMQDAAELFDQVCDGDSWGLSAGMMAEICTTAGRDLPRDVCRVVESLCSDAQYAQRVLHGLSGGGGAAPPPPPAAHTPPPAVLQVAAAAPQPLLGKKLCFTGCLSLRRAEAAARAVAAGAVVTDTVGCKTYVVAGPGAGGKLFTAKEKGCTVWSEADFEAALREAPPPPPPPAKRKREESGDSEDALPPPAKHPKKQAVAAVPAALPPLPVAGKKGPGVRGHAPTSPSPAPPDIAGLLQRLRAGEEPGLVRLLTTRGDDAMPAAPVDPEHPQKLQGCTVEKVVGKMLKSGAAGSFFCDTKYDGERLLVHMPEGAGMAFWSRNRLAVPERKTGGVAARLAAALRPERAGVAGAVGGGVAVLRCTSVLLDCEILSQHTFGSQNKVSKAELLERGPRVYPFDIMFYNGHLLTGVPLRKRRELLHLVVEQVDRQVEHVESMCIDAGRGGAEKRLQAAYDDTIRHAIEGLVVKACDGPYKFGGKSNWVKLKRRYIPTAAKMDPKVVAAARGNIMDEDTADLVANGIRAAPAAEAGTVICSPLTETVDCLVPAVTSCRGRLVLAVADTAEDGRFRTCGTVPIPKGFRLPRWSKMVNVHGGRPPGAAPPALPCSNYCDVKTRRAQFHVGKAFPFARDCPVVEVASKWLVEDPSHTCQRLGVGPDARVVRLREDKDEACTTTVQELVGWFNEGKIKARNIE